jgi:hypothetical protein
MPFVRIVPRILVAGLVFFPWGFYPVLFLPLGFSWLALLGWGAWLLGASYGLIYIPAPYQQMALDAALLSFLCSSALALVINVFPFLDPRRLIGARENSKKRDAEEFFAFMGTQEDLPVIEARVDLHPNEFIVFQERCNHLEYRTSGKSWSKTRSHKAFMSGWISQSQTQRDQTEELSATSRGTAYITNFRVLFIGEKRSFEKYHGDVLSTSPGGENIVIHFRGRTKPIALSLKNPYIWDGWHRFLRHANVYEPKIPHKYMEIEGR